MILTDEIKAKLTAEQLVVVEKWILERQEREKIISKLEAGELSPLEAMYQLTATSPEYCEHNRSIMSNCHCCDEIEQIINPDFSKELE
jgi:hypothetical protein